MRTNRTQTVSNQQIMEALVDISGRLKAVENGETQTVSRSSGKKTKTKKKVSVDSKGFQPLERMRDVFSISGRLIPLETKKLKSGKLVNVAEIDIEDVTKKLVTMRHHISCTFSGLTQLHIPISGGGVAGKNWLTAVFNTPYIAKLDDSKRNKIMELANKALVVYERCLKTGKPPEEALENAKLSVTNNLPNQS